ncbi:MAG TPA: phosphoenolpyruvate-utilizing N-terminal domain-containing protein, partial [Verrucomicrobiae bacterium]|nr:phosphoenolpyruvate-utilizing N-terminal domain-containing protein [Verrucomicrobiae bacterium]
MSDRRPELIFSGKVASPGLAAGSIRLHARPKVDASPAGSPEEEAARLAAALEAAAARLQDLASDAAEEAAAILEFQIALVEDGELID